MKMTTQGDSIYRLAGKWLLATTAAAYVLIGSPMVQAVESEGPPQDPSAVPEAGVWLVGAGVLVMLSFEFLRRKFARNRLQARAD